MFQDFQKLFLSSQTHKQKLQGEATIFYLLSLARGFELETFNMEAPSPNHRATPKGRSHKYWSQKKRAKGAQRVIFMPHKHPSSSHLLWYPVSHTN